MTTQFALSLSGVHKTYKANGPAPLQVLRGVDLNIAKGEVVALTAPSGAGKSTLLHVAGLLDTPDQGEIVVGGQKVEAKGDRRRTAIRRNAVGFVYQAHHLMQEFSALENVMLPQLAAGIGKKQAAQRANELLSSVGLAERVKHRPAELSGGEQQRVAICRALANRPLLLLADEPTGNLDPRTSDGVFDMLMALARSEDLACLIATHDMDLAERMDRTVRLEDGVVTG